MLRYQGSSLVALLIFISYLSLIANCQRGEPCPSVIGRPSCVCEHPEGKGTISAEVFGLTGINAPRFKDVYEDKLGDYYSFNPCYSYNEGLCSDVYSCQTSATNPSFQFSIASNGTEEMYIDEDGTPYLFYRGPGGRQVYVFLHCTSASESETELVSEGDFDLFFTYIFHLYSGEVCPGGNAPAAVAAGVIGIVVIVVLIIGVVVYLVTGIIIMRVQYNASGVDMIPNKAFWKSLPGLIKDGTLFAFSPCIRLCKKDGEYDPLKS